MSRPLVRIRVCGPANRIGQRLVVATCDGDEIHRDEFSVNDAARRQRFREAIAAKVPSSSLAWIDDAILQSAEAYDVEAASKSDGVRFALYPAAKLAASEFRVEYLVDGILAAQQPAFVLGPHKALKTSLALDQAISLATGTPHLNRFTVPTPRRVLFMSGESGLSTLKETAERICRSKFADLAEVGNLVFSDMVPSLANALHLSELGRVLAGEAVEVLYVDPLYLALDAGGNEASIFAMGAVLRGVSQLCQSHRVTLVLLHHLKRGNGQQRGPAELSDASWAGPAEFARQWCVVSRREPYRPGTGVHELWFNVGGSAGHNGLYAVTVDEGIGYGNRHWSVECLDAADALREQEADQQRRKADHHQRKLDDHAWQLRETLGRFGDGETVTALRTNARLNPANFDEAMGTLLGRGEAERCDVRKGNRSHEGFKPTARLLRRPDQPTRPDQNSIPQKLVG